MSTMKAHDTHDLMLVHCRCPKHSHTIEHGIRLSTEIVLGYTLIHRTTSSIKLVPNKHRVGDVLHRVGDMYRVGDEDVGET